MADQPSFIPSAWAANNSTTETIPATTTESGKASWDQGFPVETSLPLSEGGIPPKYGDFNGILNVLSQFCLFAQAGGQFTWSSTLSYSVGSIVVGSDGSIYRAVQATTNVNPVGDTSGKWERIVSKSDIDALESDIQTAMTNAENAVANASAAQSAVTTLDANVVKLSGDQTVGGVKTFSNTITVKSGISDVAIKASGNAGWVRIGGGSDGKSTTGAVLVLCGINSGSGNAGRFKLYASDGTNYKTFIGDPDGTLTWDNKEFVYTSTDQTVAGLKSFSSAVVATSTTGIRRDVDNSEMRLDGGSSFSNGASLVVYGKTASGNAGNFRVRANDGSLQTDLIGKPDGTLTWNGQPVQTSSDERIKTPLAGVPDAVLDAWGDVGWGQYKYLDAVEAKGESARLHLGLIAQHVKAVFEERGLDACAYGILCHEERPASEDEQAVDLWMVRYTEAAAMEAAYQRRRADRAEARLADIEVRLSVLEAKA